MRLFALLAVGLSFAGAPVLAQPKSAGAPDPKLVEDLVVANHVLADFAAFSEAPVVFWWWILASWLVFVSPPGRMAISILAALYQKRGGAKDRTEHGADIRIGLFENCLFLVAQHMVEYEMTGHKPRSMPEREHAWPIYDIFETAGGERIFIGVVTEGHWQSFCREFGLQEFSEDPAFRTTTDRILARTKIIPRVAEVIRRRNAAELSERDRRPR